MVFVGDGPMRAGLEARARELGLDRVTFTGQVAAVEDWLRRAEIVVRSSYSEGLALAVLEAMAAGRCNVVSDIAPNRELIEDGVTGLVFRCGDPADLAQALRRVILDPEERARLAGAAQLASTVYAGIGRRPFTPPPSPRWLGATAVCASAQAPSSPDATSAGSAGTA